MALETLGMGAASAISPWMAAAGAVPELFKLGQGIAQSVRARKIERSQQRPTYTPPAAAVEALANQRALAAGEAPGMSAARNQLASSMGGSIAAIQGSGGGQAERLAALTRLNRNASLAALDLGARQQEWRASQEANLINQLDRFAPYQEAAWEYNRNKPYQEAMQMASDLRTTGVKNQYSALKQGAALAGAAMVKEPPAPTATGAASRTGMAGGGLSTILGAYKPKQFDPQASADQTYDFDAIEAERQAKNKALGTIASKYRRVNPTDRTPLTTDREIVLEPYSGGMF